MDNKEKVNVAYRYLPWPISNKANSCIFIWNFLVVYSLAKSFLFFWLLQVKLLRCHTTTSRRTRWNSLASKTLEAKSQWTGGLTAAWTSPELLVLLTYHVPSSPSGFFMSEFIGRIFQTWFLTGSVLGFQGTTSIRETNLCLRRNRWFLLCLTSKCLYLMRTTTSWSWHVMAFGK